MMRCDLVSFFLFCFLSFETVNMILYIRNLHRYIDSVVYKRIRKYICNDGSMV